MRYARGLILVDIPCVTFITVRWARHALPSNVQPQCSISYFTSLLHILHAPKIVETVFMMDRHSTSGFGRLELRQSRGKNLVRFAAREQNTFDPDPSTLILAFSMTR